MPGGCRGPRGVAGFLGAGLAAGWCRGRAGAGRAASSGAGRFPFARRPARWPSPRRPSTSAAAWCPVAFGWCSRKGASQCSAAPAGAVSGINDDDSTGPRWQAIWASRPPSFPVGMPATARRNPRPRLPREGLLPWRSRPSARASAKSRSSITIARAPSRRAVATMVLIAARSRPSRVRGGLPGQVQADGRRAPEDVAVRRRTAATARCPAFTSTATTGCCRNSSSVAAAAGAVFHARVDIPPVACRVTG